MLLILGFGFGFGFGWLRAGKRGGNRLDKLQYAAAHGIAFAIATLALSILVVRLGLV